MKHSLETTQSATAAAAATAATTAAAAAADDDDATFLYSWHYLHLGARQSLNNSLTWRVI